MQFGCGITAGDQRQRDEREQLHLSNPERCSLPTFFVERSLVRSMLFFASSFCILVDARRVHRSRRRPSRRPSCSCRRSACRRRAGTWGGGPRRSSESISCRRSDARPTSSFLFLSTPGVFAARRADAEQTRGAEPPAMVQTPSRHVGQSPRAPTSIVSGRGLNRSRQPRMFPPLDSFFDSFSS